MHAAGAAGVAAVDEQALRRNPAGVRHPLARALLGLTFTTGLIDAASYLGLGRVFTANMTGNIVLLGFGIAGTGALPWWRRSRTIWMQRTRWMLPSDAEPPATAVRRAPRQLPVQPDLDSGNARHAGTP